MNSRNLELIEFKRKYQNQWVALDPKTGKVLASNKNLKIIAKSKSLQNKDYVLEKVTPLNSLFIPTTIIL
jgi:hypothetical protein